MAKTFKVVDGDILTSAASGRHLLVSGKEKVYQDINEFFEVDVQPSGFGAGIEQLVGSVGDGNESMISIVDKQIQDGFSSLISLINAEPRILRTAVERLMLVKNITVSTDPTNPTSIIFSLDILTENGILTVSDSN